LYSPPGTAMLPQQDKEALVRQYLPLIRHMASRYSWGLPPQLSTEDLVSAGVVGLLDALRRYDGRVKLRSFVEPRIRGSMLDALRAADWMPRSTRERLRMLRQTQASLHKALGRPPTDEEMARALNLSARKYRLVLFRTQGQRMVSLEALAQRISPEEPLDLLECIPAQAPEDPFRELELQRLKARLKEALRGLPSRDRLILRLYYWKGLTMKRIGRLLGLTESRVCQIHKTALLRLRAALEKGQADRP